MTGSGRWPGPILEWSPGMGSSCDRDETSAVSSPSSLKEAGSKAPASRTSGSDWAGKRLNGDSRPNVGDEPLEKTWQPAKTKQLDIIAAAKQVFCDAVSDVFLDQMVRRRIGSRRAGRFPRGIEMSRVQKSFRGWELRRG